MPAGNQQRGIIPQRLGKARAPEILRAKADQHQRRRVTMPLNQRICGQGCRERHKRNRGSLHPGHSQSRIHRRRNAPAEITMGGQRFRLSGDTPLHLIINHRIGKCAARINTKKDRHFTLHLPRTAIATLAAGSIGERDETFLTGNKMRTHCGAGRRYDLPAARFSFASAFSERLASLILRRR